MAKKRRGRLEIAGDIYKVFEQRLKKAEEKKLLEPLFLEMQEFEARQQKQHEREMKKLAAKPQTCSPYEIFHNRGCGTCATCLADGGERYYTGKPKFLTR